ncbi:hypothetical protein MNV49_002532 [Pseudohyphozyma bogoriensis]|nr:hypothetical protein MNV49_002532 [Pseudohyphozyma bogoriensis]
MTPFKPRTIGVMSLSCMMKLGARTVILPSVQPRRTSSQTARDPQKSAKEGAGDDVHSKAFDKLLTAQRQREQADEYHNAGQDAVAAAATSSNANFRPSAPPTEHAPLPQAEAHGDSSSMELYQRILVLEQFLRDWNAYVSKISDENVKLS